MNKKNSLFGNTIILTIGTFLPKLSGLITLPILTAYLTKTEYGTYDLILTGASFVIPIFTLQIEQAVFRYLIDVEDSDRKTVISTSLIFIGIVSLLSFGLCYIGFEIYNGSGLLFGVYIVVELLYKYILQVLRGFRQTHIYSLVTVTNSLVGLVGICILVWKLRLGLPGLITALSLGYLTAVSIGCISTRIFRYFSYRSFNRYNLKEMLRYSLPLLPNAISWWVVGTSDRWIIVWRLGVEVNAVYSVANKIPSLFNTAYTCFNLAWQESAIDNAQEESRYYQKMLDLVIPFLGSVLLVMIASSRILFMIFVDSSYSNAYDQMSILFVAMFFHCMASFLGGIYVAKKKSRQVGVSAFVGAIVNILINILLIDKIGLYAASISTLISYFIIFVYRYYDMRREIGIRLPKKQCILLCIFTLTVIYASSYKKLYIDLPMILLTCIYAFMTNRKLIKSLVSRIIPKRRK